MLCDGPVADRNTLDFCFFVGNDHQGGAAFQGLMDPYFFSSGSHPPVGSENLKRADIRRGTSDGDKALFRNGIRKADHDASDRRPVQRIDPLRFRSVSFAPALFRQQLGFIACCQIHRANGPRLGIGIPAGSQKPPAPIHNQRGQSRDQDERCGFLPSPHFINDHDASAPRLALFLKS